MILGIIYEFGKGTDTVAALALKWLKSALEKMGNDRNNRANLIRSIGVIRGELNEYNSAGIYCTTMCCRR